MEKKKKFFRCAKSPLRYIQTEIFIDERYDIYDLIQK